MKTIIKAWYLLILFSLHTACDNVHFTGYTSGIILDELNRPIEGVLIENSGGVTTDKNGYFKADSINSFELIVSKHGFITDTIPFMWHQSGETTEHSPYMTSDSTILILKRKANHNDIMFKPIENNRHLYDTIINSKFPIKNLKGTWLKNKDKKLNGFRFDDNFYFFGIKGYRYMRYYINNDTIKLYHSYKAFYTKGIIKSATKEAIEIHWIDTNTSIRYNKVK